MALSFIRRHSLPLFTTLLRRFLYIYWNISTTKQRRALQADTSVIDQQEVILSKETDIQEPVLSQCIGLKLEDCEKLLFKKYPKAEVVAVPTKQYDYNRILIRYNNETGKCDLAPGRG